MTYALDFKQDGKHENLIIDGEKIVHRMGNNPFLTINRSNLSGYDIQPGRVRYEPRLNENSTVIERKALFEELIQQGTTLVVTTCLVKEPQHVKKRLTKAKHLMINSPMDYVIGISVHIKDLTPQLCIELSKYPIPFVTFLFADWGEVYSKTWEWIRDAWMGKQPLFIPQWMSPKQPRVSKKAFEEWRNFTQSLGIWTSLPLSSDEPLNMGQLKALGIYPVKGALRPGADCDYILNPVSLEGNHPNSYDKNTPSIVVIRGKIQFAGQTILRPGYGREVIIPMPCRFTDFWECI